MNNIIFAVLHLQKASDLLKYQIPNISNTLLELAFTIIKNEKIKQEDINSLSNLIDTVNKPIEDSNDK